MRKLSLQLLSHLTKSLDMDKRDLLNCLPGSTPPRLKRLPTCLTGRDLPQKKGYMICHPGRVPNSVEGFVKLITKLQPSPPPPPSKVQAPHPYPPPQPQKKIQPAKSSKNDLLIYPPYTSAEIVNLGLDYRTQNLTDPPGWSQTDIAMALRLGYSKAGLHNLRPTSRASTLAQVSITRIRLRPTY